MCIRDSNAEYGVSPCGFMLARMRGWSPFRRVLLIVVPLALVWLLLVWLLSGSPATSKSAVPAPVDITDVLSQLRANYPHQSVEQGGIPGLVNVIRPSATPAEDSVTLTTHFTIDRVPHFVQICERWRGPVSAVVLIRSLADHNAVLAMSKNNPLVARHASIHYLLATTSTGYPVNHLRNFAIKSLLHRTKWIFPLDADFVPGGGTDAHPDAQRSAHDQILADVKVADALSDGPTVLIVPGFESDTSDISISSKPQLIAAVNSGDTVRPVLSKSFFLAHENVDYPKWYKAVARYQLEYDFFFEPYYVARTDGFILYDEKFSFYGHDKASHTYEITARGWKMFALPNSFAVHAKHTDNWSGKPDRPAVYRRIAAQMRDMKAKYKFWPRLPSNRWFNQMFTDGDTEQAEFKKELLHIAWEQIRPRH
eukprot:TRINITY_DN18896_c0_g1_i2.p1 TRINITY_DN18896_c0_g1~~TRINITY_DN18896_c0_g1_i2.p1  ORF type:complete len:424 (+),score=51.85 TRINITY_DN18896_c0_g1_i2:99-1370(+)